MKILFIGEIFGKPGREIVRRGLPALIDRHQIDFVIANGENSAAGFGITGDIADVLFGYGIDVMTSGNHVWDKKEVLEYLPRQTKLLRPANFPAGVPGRGAYLGRTRTGEPVEKLREIFDRGMVAIVMDGNEFLGLITRMDLLNWLRRRGA